MNQMAKMLWDVSSHLMTFSGVRIEHGVLDYDDHHVTRDRHVLVLLHADDEHAWHDVREYDGPRDVLRGVLRNHGDQSFHGDRHDDHHDDRHD